MENNNYIANESAFINPEVFDSLLAKTNSCDLNIEPRLDSCQFEMKPVGSPFKFIMEDGSIQMAHVLEKKNTPDVLSSNYFKNGILNRCRISGKLLHLLTR